MNKAVKRDSVQRIPVMLLVLLLGALLLPLTSSPAYAADNAATQQSGSTQVSLMAGQLTGSQLAGSISSTPYNKKSQYEVYSTYFFVNAGGNACAGCQLYLGYRQASKDGKRWGDWKVSGPMYSYGDYTIKGLKANRRTQTAFIYSSLYTRGATSKPSRLVTFTTGPNKRPGIKSVKVQAVNLTKHKEHHVSPYTGYVYQTIYDIYYTYKIKTTVKLKKPLKSGYLMINSKTFKAKGKNKGKKTFTVTTAKKLGYYSPRGTRYKVSVCTYQNKTWKGYSKLYQKNVKIK